MQDQFVTNWDQTRCFTDQVKAAGLSRSPPDAEQRSLLDRIILDIDKPQIA